MKRLDQTSFTENASERNFTISDYEMGYLSKIWSQFIENLARLDDNESTNSIEFLVIVILNYIISLLINVVKIKNNKNVIKKYLIVNSIKKIHFLFVM